MKKRPTFWGLASLGILFLTWICVNEDIYLDPNVYLSRDNAHSHFPSFSYIVNHLKFFGSFPDWFMSKEGGIWSPTLSNLLVLLAPHRMVSYLWGALTSTHLNYVYKVSYLILGQGVFLLLSFFALKEIFQSSLWAVAVLVLGFLTSSGVSLLHQESSFSVICLIPVLWLSFLKAKENPIWLIPLFASAGYGLNLYYPQLFLCYFFILFLAAVLSWKETKSQISLVWVKSKNQKPILVTSLFVFIVCASPILYSYLNYWNEVGSPLRERETTLSAKSYDELVSFQSKRCNIAPINFIGYLGSPNFEPTSLDPQDARSLFAGPLGGLCLLLLFFVRFPNRKFQVVTLLLLWLFAMGFYGPVPRLLWWWFPGLKMFRQYYHFIEIFNLHWIVFCAWVIRTSLTTAKISVFVRRTVLSLVGITVFIINYSWTNKTVAAYREDFKETLVAEGIRPPHSFDEKSYAEELLLKQEFPYEAGTKTLKPLGVAHGAYLRIWEKVGGLHFQYRKVKIPYHPEDLSVAVRGKAFEIGLERAPGLPNSLEIHQFNDGLWKASTLDGKPLPVGVGILGNISIPSVTSGTTIRVWREASTWGIVVGLAFFTFGVALCFPLLQLRNKFFLKNLKEKRPLLKGLRLPAPTFSTKTFGL